MRKRKFSIGFPTPQLVESRFLRVFLSFSHFFLFDNRNLGYFYLHKFDFCCLEYRIDSSEKKKFVCEVVPVCVFFLPSYISAVC